MPVVQKTDILIIGAGICGLYTAYKLLKSGKTVCILEADSRIGGRIQTIRNKLSLPLEAGAEFVHGDLPLTRKLAKEAGVKFIKQKANYYRANDTGIHKVDELVPNIKPIIKKMNELTADIPLSQFIETHMNGDEFKDSRPSLAHLAEGFDVAETEKISTMYVKKELDELRKNEMFRIEAGYGSLVEYLYKEVVANGGIVILNAKVEKIALLNGIVNAEYGDNKIFKADKAVITLPIGILNAEGEENGKIKFDPPLSEYMEAAKNIGFGPVVKVNFQFRRLIWNDETPESNIRQLSGEGFILSDGKFQVWWTQKKELPLITGWCGGPNARLFKFANETEIFDNAVQSLAGILKCPEIFIKDNLTAWHISNWGANPLFKGAYSYDTPESGKARKKLNEPVEDMLFFAGEALNEAGEVGTVEAALQSAEQVIKKMENSFDKA